MYKFINKQAAEIWYNPIIENEYLICNGKDKTVKVFDNNLDLITQFGDNVSYITTHRQHVFLQTEQGLNIWKFGDNKNELKKIDGVQVLPAHFSNHHLYANYTIDSGTQIGVFDYQSLTLKKTFNAQIGRDITEGNGKLFFLEKNVFAQKVFCINPYDGAYDWVFDLTEQDIMEQRLGAYLYYCNDSILVSLGAEKLGAIDIITGKLKWIKTVNDRIQFYNTKIINVDASFYREISANTGEVLSEYFMEEEYAKNGFRYMGTNNHFTVTDSHIFIVDALSNVLGAINRNTGKIDWVTKVEANVTLPHAPLIDNQQLFIVDHVGTLYQYSL